MSDLETFCDQTAAGVRDALADARCNCGGALRPLDVPPPDVLLSQPGGPAVAFEVLAQCVACGLRGPFRYLHSIPPGILDP